MYFYQWWIHAYTCEYVCVSVCLSVCLSVSVCVCVCVCVCPFIYIRGTNSEKYKFWKKKYSLQYCSYNVANTRLLMSLCLFFLDNVGKAFDKHFVPVPIITTTIITTVTHYYYHYHYHYSYYYSYLKAFDKHFVPVLGADLFFFWNGILFWMSLCCASLVFGFCERGCFLHIALLALPKTHSSMVSTLNPKP